MAATYILLARAASAAPHAYTIHARNDNRAKAMAKDTSKRMARLYTSFQLLRQEEGKDDVNLARWRVKMESMILAYKER